MEKRRYERLIRDLKVSYMIIAEVDKTPFEFGNSQLLDISKTGLAMLVDEPVPTRMLLQLQMHLPEHPAGLIVLGKTVYCKPEEELGLYRVGIRFVGIVQPDLETDLDELQRSIDSQIAP